MFDGKAFGLEIVEATKAFVIRSLEPIVARMAAAEKRLVELADLFKAPPTEAEWKALLAAEIAKALDERVPKEVASLELKIDAEDLKKAVGDAVAPFVGSIEKVAADLAEVQDLVTGLPGADGLAALVDRAVDAKVAALPAIPTAAEVAVLVPAGKDADQAAILDLVVAEVGKAVSAVPAPKDGKDADPEVMRAMVAEQVAALPKAIDGTSVSLEDVLPLVAEAVKASPAPAGKDADPEVIAGLVKDGIAAVMTPLQGAVDAAIADVRAVTEAAILEVKAALPAAADIAALVAPGKDADQAAIDALVKAGIEAVRLAGETALAEIKALVPTAEAVAALVPVGQDGKSVTLEDVRPVIDEGLLAAVAALPPAVVPPEAIAAAVSKELATWERPKDGTSVSAEDLLPVVGLVVDKALAARPVPKDGIGLAGTLIDQDGVLVATMTDGTIHKLGPVRGEKGLDGFGFDDMSIVDERMFFIVRFVKGDLVKEFKVAKPTLADMHRGIWREGSYQRGSVVTWSGSQWLAIVDTDGKPETTKDWTLIVKRGRDGKDFTPTDPTKPKPVKL